MGFTWFMKGWAYVEPYVEKVKPSFLTKAPFTFINLHYFYIIGSTIVGSVMIFPNGGMHYVDALFFASGSATQSGLNTIDINRTSTYQQIIMLIIAMMCNPMTINTGVVFLRLYWFEKRFQHAAMEARKNKRISRTRSEVAAEDAEKWAGQHRGVNGRDIVVMHNTSRPIPGDGTDKDDFGKMASATEDGRDETLGGSGPSSEGRSSTTQTNDQPTSDQHPPGITFADQVKRSDGMEDEALRPPAMMSRTQEHINIVERQRGYDEEILRIPGPRDADAGRTPERVDEAESRRELARRNSSYAVRGKDAADVQGEPNEDEEVHEDQERRRNIVIQEPVRPHNDHHRKEHVAQDLDAAGHALGFLRLRKPKIFTSNTDDNPRTLTKQRAMSFSTLKTAITQSKTEDMPYLSYQATVGRNSAFADLTEEQREELGGVEYRSLKTLSNGLLIYIWGYTIFGIICLVPWILHTSYGTQVTKDGQGRPWWGIFTAVSAFTDLGFTLTPDSMISFQDAVWPLLLMSFLIVIGNTGFPIMLRFLIWLFSMIVPRDSALWEELKFLLDHPRRCFALLFPAAATWWLLGILVVLNGIDLILFIILDLGNTVVTQLPVNIRILDGFFQAISTRTAGFGVVNLASLHPGIQVSYLIMMYISVLPIAMSVRRTNVYEEKSLGIYGTAAEENEDENEPSYVSAHLRRQLSFDLWFIFLGFFIIAIAEGKRIQDDNEPAFSMFAVLFEIVSAYGTVGLSLGYPNTNASFSAEFGVVSKLVIIAMQIRGRHRGLPYDLDRAILLKGELQREKDDQMSAMSVRRRNSNATVGTTSGAATGMYNMNDGPGSRTSLGNNNKVLSLSRGRTGRTFDKGTEFFAGFLRPGPTMPNLKRYDERDIPATSSRRMRRYSAADLGSREDRRVSIGEPITENPGNMGGGGDDGTKSKRLSGRRNFHQEGLNDNDHLE